MSLLQDVMSIRDREQAQRDAMFNAIPQAINTYIAARRDAEARAQQQKAAMLDEMLAKKKMEDIDSEIRTRERVDPLDALLKNKQIENIDSQIKARDRVDPLQQYLEKGKLTDAARSMGDVETLNNLIGAPTQNQTVNQFLSPEVAASMPKVPVDPQADLYAKSTEQKFNILSGKMEPTPEALAAKDQIEINKKVQEKKSAGIAMETGGKVVMATQAIKDLQDARKMLFPDGTINSYDRKLAGKSNIPLVGAWPNDAKSQMLYSRMQNAVAAKLRIETGAQANPSEVKNIMNRFGISLVTAPEAAMDFLNRLEGFMSDTIKITEPGAQDKKEGNSQYKVGDILDTPKGKVKIVGFYEDGEPNVELVK